MFSIRLTTSEDYISLCEWWAWHRFPSPAQDCLPENGTCGIMIMKGDVNICAGFIYFTNSKLAWIEYIVSNPEYKENDRKEAIRLLIDELTDACRRKGFTAAFTSVKNQHLIKHYEACGYTSGSNNTQEMIIVL